MNTAAKYVASTTLDTVQWTNSSLITGDLAAQVDALKGRPGRELQVHSSGDLMQTLTHHDLVDEYRLFVYPAIVGSGRSRALECLGPP